MPTVLERVDAMRTLLDLLPDQPSPESRFESDAAGLPFHTYDVVRTRLQDGIVELKVAARVAQDKPVRARGLHLVMLRPALVSAAKAWWLVDDKSANSRVSRAIVMVAADRANGACAMAAAGKLGELQAFEGISEKFADARVRIQRLAEQHALDLPRLPRDGELIDGVGREVDLYYGTRGANSARLDVRLLWNASSGLAHGERWFSDLALPRLATAAQRNQIIETLTNRSLDVVCSALNVTALRCLFLATAPPL